MSSKQGSNRSGSEVIKLFSCSTQLSMKFVLLINKKLLRIANSFLLGGWLGGAKVSCIFCHPGRPADIGL